MDWEVLAYITIGCVAGFAIYRVILARGEGAPGLFATVACSCTAWWLLFWVQKVISWAIWQGRGLALGYGGDKSLSNFVLEPPLVVILAAVAALVARWLLGSRYSRRVAVSLAVGVAIVVVSAVPALPE